MNAPTLTPEEQKSLAEGLIWRLDNPNPRRHIHKGCSPTFRGSRRGYRSPRCLTSREGVSCGVAGLAGAATDFAFGLKPSGGSLAHLGRHFLQDRQRELDVAGNGPFPPELMGYRVRGDTKQLSETLLTDPDAAKANLKRLAVHGTA